MGDGGVCGGQLDLVGCTRRRRILMFPSSRGAARGDPSRRTLRIWAEGSRARRTRAHAFYAPQVKPRRADGTARAKCVGALRQAQDKLRISSVAGINKGQSRESDRPPPFAKDARKGALAVASSILLEMWSAEPPGWCSA
jgi:hypothetical protein